MFAVIDNCEPNPCQNQGICTSFPQGRYECDCPPGYTGGDCEKGKEILV